MVGSVLGAICADTVAGKVRAIKQKAIRMAVLPLEDVSSIASAELLLNAVSGQKEISMCMRLCGICVGIISQPNAITLSSAPLFSIIVHSFGCNSSLVAMS